MNTYVLQLQEVGQVREVRDVVSFIGSDAQGAFGIMACHERMMTALGYGLSRYRTADGLWHYLVQSGGLLYFLDNTLIIAARRIFQDDDLNRILGSLEDQLKREEEELRLLKQQMQHLEQEMLRRIMRLKTESN